MKTEPFMLLLQDSVHCALEMSRLQVEEWKNQGPQALEEALTQKVLLQEELVTIRARMCDVSLVCIKLKEHKGHCNYIWLQCVISEREWISNLLNLFTNILIFLIRKWSVFGVSMSEWKVNYLLSAHTFSTSVTLECLRYF